MADLPAGTVTFLFTDVEGSTELLGAHPDAYRAAVRRHHDLLRAAVEAHSGVVFETVGDAVYAAFAGPTDAVGAALQGQLALLAEPWGEVGELQVRIGVHAGEVEVQGDHYFGAPLYRCARLMSTAHGGQVVLSEAAAALVRDALPEGGALQDLGEHRLKDLRRPERVFQLLHPALPAIFPPLRSLDTGRHNLPVQSTPLIGREREVDALCRRLRQPEVRLLTLTGPGGTGKTRVALQVAADALDDFVDGTWFVPLAAITDPALVLSAIAQTLGVRESGGRTLAEAVRDHVREKRLLLVLDNMEQVLPAAPAIAELLAACPHLKVLVTSREVLRLSGEHDYPVPPLALPDPISPPPPERLTQYESVRLFIDRAVAARPDFAVTNETAPAVAEICHRLDGLPLAIELAAARIRLLPVPALLTRLERRLPLLTGGGRDLPLRQQALRNTIAWSHDLLTGPEQALFRRLGVFAGGCSLEAVAAVCESDSELDVLEGIASLVDKSLLRQHEVEDGQPRFTMLETMREFALEQLAASDDASEPHRRHAAHFLAQAQAAVPQLRGGDAAQWLARLEREHDNFRAALGWALDAGEAETALRLGVALLMFWYTRGYLSEGRRWLESALARAGAPPPALRASAVSSLGILVWEQGDYSRAVASYEEALALHRALGNRTGVARALGNLAWVALYQSDFVRAAPLCEESLALFLELDDRTGMGIALNRLGSLAYHQGKLDEAQAFHEQSLALRRASGDARGVAVVQCNLGRAALAKGELAAARALLSESLATAHRLGDREGIAANLEEHAALAAAEGQGVRAARLFGVSEAMRATIGAPLPPVDRTAHDRAVAAARALLEEPAFAAGWSSGRSMPPEQAVAYALEPHRPAP